MYISCWKITQPMDRQELSAALARAETIFLRRLDSQINGFGWQAPEGGDASDSGSPARPMPLEYAASEN